MLLRTFDDCRHIITRVNKNGVRTTCKVPIMPSTSFKTNWKKYKAAKESRKPLKKSIAFPKLGPRPRSTKEEKEMIVLGAQSYPIINGNGALPKDKDLVEMTAAAGVPMSRRTLNRIMSEADNESDSRKSKKTTLKTKAKSLPKGQIEERSEECMRENFSISNVNFFGKKVETWNKLALQALTVEQKQTLVDPDLGGCISFDERSTLTQLTDILDLEGGFEVYQSLLALKGTITCTFFHTRTNIADRRS